MTRGQRFIAAATLLTVALASAAFHVEFDKRRSDKPDSREFLLLNLYTTADGPPITLEEDEPIQGGGVMPKGTVVRPFMLNGLFAHGNVDRAFLLGIVAPIVLLGGAGLILFSASGPRA